MLIRDAKADELPYIKHLYDASFPPAEKKPFSLILEKCADGKMEILVLIQDTTPLGLMITVLHKDLVLLDYFAIDTDSRGRGTGSAALALFRQRYKGKQLLLEIEVQDINADNADQRRRRKAFYLRNGLLETGLRAVLFGVEMEILVFDSGCHIDFDDYHDIYRSLGKPIADRVEPVSTNL